jgi:hypothetical protein
MCGHGVSQESGCHECEANKTTRKHYKRRERCTVGCESRVSVGRQKRGRGRREEPDGIQPRCAVGLYTKHLACPSSLALKKANTNRARTLDIDARPRPFRVLSFSSEEKVISSHSY